MTATHRPGGVLARFATAVAAHLRGGLVHQAVPLAVCGSVHALGAPWEAVLAMLVGAQYWYAPLVVYATQRSPAVPSIEPVDDDAAVPPPHAAVLAAVLPDLHAAGFVTLLRFGSADPARGLQATGMLLQHPETTDLAHVLVATQDGNPEVGSTVSFSRPRGDGSMLATARLAGASPFAPSPRDSVLRVGRRVRIADLWRAHRGRTAADPLVMRRPRVTDALAVQRDLERDAARRWVADGLYQPDVAPHLLRPTLRGAYRMCLRMLPPWREVSRVRGHLHLRRLLRHARG